MHFVGPVGKDLLFNAIKAGTGNDGFQLATQLVRQFASFGKEFETYVGNGCAFKLTIYEYVVPSSFFYPMVWLANSSTISPSTSASELVSVLLSLAWNTMFWMVFTLVGEPDKPHCARSPSTSATLHSTRFR